MKGKKIGTSVLAAVMLAGTTAMPALAAMPTQSVVIGEKAFSLEYANNVENIKEIQEALKGNIDKIFVKFNNKWFNNDGSNLADASVIPAVAYVTADGTVNYEAGDGEEVTEGFNIVDISPVGVKKIKVAFSDAVDTDKASFEVKKGSIVRNQDSVEWNDEKTEATINLLGIISEGDYTVTVKGTDLEGDAAKSTFSAKDEKVTTIEILGDKAPVTHVTVGTEEKQYVTVDYKVKNQYGETMKNESPKVTVTLDARDEAKNEYYVSDNAVALKIPFTVTIIDTNTGTYASKVMTPVAEAKVSKVELSGLYKLKDDKMVEATVDTGLDTGLRYVEIKAEDQYGNAITSETAVEEQATFVIADSILKVTAEKIKKHDDKLYVELAAGTNITAMDLELRVVANANGNTAVQKISISEKSKLDKFELELPEDLIVAGETIEFKFNAYDQNGKELSEADKKALASVEGFQITSSNGTFAFGYDYETSKATLKLTTVNNNVDIPATVMVVTPSGQVINKRITVKAAAVAQEISLKDMTKLMTKGAETTIDEDNLVITDQYGREMEAEDFFAAYELKVEATNADDKDVTLEGNEATTSSAIVADSTITFTGAKTGKKGFALKFNKKGADKVLFTYDFALETVSADDIASYDVELPEVLYNGTTGSTVTNDYAKAYSVFGKTSSGKEIALKADTDYIINFSDTYIDDTTVAGKIMGKNAELGKAEDKDDEKDLAVLIFTKHNNGTISKSIKLKEEAPKMVETKIKKDKTVIYIKEADATAAKIVESIKSYIEQVDQYGVKHALAADEYDYLTATKPSDDTVEFSINGQNFTVNKDLEKDTSFTATLLQGTDKLNVTVKVVE
ncbi:hypothetical protein [Oceanirhabdus sp. W0125-5]|uniref:hypothetical protein n=1 Tax=Oceanirhabdus sp. W0125-5 TaxID=2999116 RepID=UPI0022F32B81|nr:hypothetical protein [Oceanirhabdus sp. W0125-5]WBW98647.1 hypothetical protein OW730_07785 [Oceanirhabdus sp. W0125-5]